MQVVSQHALSSLLRPLIMPGSSSGSYLDHGSEEGGVHRDGLQDHGHDLAADACAARGRMQEEPSNGDDSRCRMQGLLQQLCSDTCRGSSLQNVHEQQVSLKAPLDWQNKAREPTG